jgi:hypothetical protein
MKGKWIDVDLKGKDKFDLDADYRILETWGDGQIAESWTISLEFLT